ncbi:hypothetical protein CQW23_30250 [Capsicum baccatum]|uniref:DUF4378 domain-containing protein n=1 Tax=Capsicum baccatum TaxID=33114 RepID=A0A2G2VAY5_CAPBA|nr:hypothetical protein CQW23_30250 [Capsicum baccatum]
MMLSEFWVVIEDLRRDSCGVELDLLTAEMELSKETGHDTTEAEHSKLAAASSKDVVCRSSSSDESELALAGATVVSADLASQISQVKSKEGLKKYTACHKRLVILMNFRFIHPRFEILNSPPCILQDSKVLRTQFIGLIPDELIEWDMIHSLGKCTDFDIEEYECGTEVARHILQELVDEVILDLYSSS